MAPPVDVVTKEGGFAKLMSNGERYRAPQQLTVTHIPLDCGGPADAHSFLLDILVPAGATPAVIDGQKVDGDGLVAKLGFESHVTADIAKYTFAIDLQGRLGARYLNARALCSCMLFIIFFIFVLIPERMW